MTDITERLRTAYLSGPDRDVLTDAADEIERLRADKDVQRSQARNAAYEAEIEVLYVEIERLSAALEMIRDDTRDDWVKNLARRALEPKP